MAFAPGQRWISNAEPELGLGTVLRAEGRNVQVLFATAGILRQYAAHAAPLARAEFRVGQRVAGKGISFTVEHVTEIDGLVAYRGEGKQLIEAELDDTQSISRADERLISGRVDRADRFDLRLEAFGRRAQARRSPAYGLAASRIDLIPHQLRVAEIVAARTPTRVLLADEVGLGKTIEAGMILARLLASGRVSRVLVLTPPSLVFQWFVELLRRFNLPFALFDEERCEAIELGGGGNPFEEDQLVLTDLGFLTGSSKRAEQIAAAGWDLLIVDEAHHLAWTPQIVSPDYALVEQLAARTPGLILLTATPEQLGRSGHFARLRLLDPARYSDLDAYITEADGYVGLSAIVETLEAGKPLDAAARSALGARLADEPELTALLTRHDTGDRAATEALLDALIDRHGTGRVMFRNRRARVGGFPQRVPRLTVLDPSSLDEDARQRLLADFHGDIQAKPPTLEIAYGDDPRLAWLLALIERFAGDKLLVIARTQAKVLALEEALRTRTGAKVARFHEGMSIVQRDRNAAFFAEPEGARVLLCSEIGSEGRNFQFAHHLILWDLPLDPDLLEQRIGRLDRIGQKHDIEIHASAFRGTAQHVLMRWYDEGLSAFSASPSDGRELLKIYGATLTSLAERHAHTPIDPDVEIDGLIAETRATHEQLSAAVQAGRDRLLELATERQARDAQLLDTLRALDADVDTDDFVLRLFEQFGIENEEQAPRTVVLDPEYVTVEGFPSLKEGPQTVTFDRATALAREELPLLRLDHPMVAGAMDLLVDGEHGNAAFLVDESLPARSALLECVFVLDCVADRRLAAERFLPPTPLRVVIDSKLAARENFAPSPASVQRAADRAIDVARYRPVLSKLVPVQLAHAETLARAQAQTVIGAALDAAERDIGAARDRLVALARVNPTVAPEEIAALEAELEGLRNALPTAAPRLDSVRFVCSADFLSLR